MRNLDRYEKVLWWTVTLICVSSAIGILVYLGTHSWQPWELLVVTSILVIATIILTIARYGKD